MKNSASAIVVGIEVASSTLKRHLALTVPRSLLATTWRATIADASARLFSIGLITLEATGGYEAAIAGALQPSGLPVTVVNPRQARDLAKAMGVLATTDSVKGVEYRDEPWLPALFGRGEEIHDVRTLDDIQASAGRRQKTHDFHWLPIYIKQSLTAFKYI